MNLEGSRCGTVGSAHKIEMNLSIYLQNGLQNEDVRTAGG
jgi:hypothetical protein